MEVLLALVGGVTLYSIINKKENFEETYYDSVNYYKQGVSRTEAKQTNVFTPNEIENRNLNLVKGDNNKFADFNNNTEGYPIADQYLRQPQAEFINKNSLYNSDRINGIPLKNYYEKYTKSVLEDGNWYLNKDMPQETKQYKDDSQIQQKMEMFTGLLQKRDRENLGVPNKQETLNLFTPEERITGYGYQYGQSGYGPGLTLTRPKELEDLKQSIKFKTNEQPFEKIQVGRGLAIGTQIPAAGGFQQFTRVLPSNISDYSSNQLPGRVAGGKWVYSNAPTSQQPVLKNKPNSYYSLCQRGPAAGKSTMTAETIRPDVAVILKNQNRTTINYGFGVPLTNLESFLEK
jgi:hypothetical protein